MARGGTQGAPFLVIGSVLAVFGAIAGYKLFIAPHGHSKVTAMRVLQTPRRSLVLAKEVVGRGTRYSDGDRLTLVEPVTAQRVAQKFLDGHFELLGQIGGPLWLEASQNELLAVDPETLQTVMTGAQVLQDHPELAGGIHDLEVDATGLAFRVVTNDGRAWRLDGASFALTPLAPRTRQDDDNDRALKSAREAATPKDPPVRFDGDSRKALKLAGGQLGADTFLSPKLLRWTPAVGDAPRAVLLVTADSLGKNASLQVVKVDPLDGRMLWTVSFPGQQKVVGSAIFKDTLTLVTAGDHYEMDDWLTSVSLAEGKVLARYQF